VKVGYRTEHSSKKADHVFDALNNAEDPSVPLSVLCEELSNSVRIVLIEDAFNQLIDYLDIRLCHYIHCHAEAVRTGKIKTDLINVEITFHCGNYYRPGK
jgi:hypothetical protein